MSSMGKQAGADWSGSIRLADSKLVEHDWAEGSSFLLLFVGEHGLGSFFWSGCECELVGRFIGRVGLGLQGWVFHRVECMRLRCAKASGHTRNCGKLLPVEERSFEMPSSA